MTTGSQTWAEDIIEVGESKLKLVKGGSGKPLLVLHGEMGYSGWMKHHEALAQHYTLHIPMLPGFGGSPRLDWVMNIRDLASWYLGVLDELGGEELSVVGFSLGGWLAAEMAAMCPHNFKSLVLVDAMGIKPPEGEIFDMFLVVANEFLTAGFLDPDKVPEFQQVCPTNVSPEQVEAWEMAREEAARLGWRPYMHDPALPNLLHRLKGLPTLVVWGKQDGIVPFSAAEVYHDSIEGSRLVSLEGCGHQPEIEKPDEFVQLVHSFLSEL